MEPIEILKKLYKDKHDIDEVIVELLADRDILHLTACGSSIESTSKFLDIDTEEVKKVNKEFYGFNGWDVDLDLNPLGIYNNMLRNGYWDYHLFEFEIETLSSSTVESLIKLMFEVCCKFYAIEKLIDEEWK